MNLTKIPQQDGFETKLSQEWDGNIWTVFLQTPPGFTMPVGETCYVVVQPTWANPKIAEFDSIDTWNNTINVTNVTLSTWAWIANPTWVTYPSNTEVIISDNYQFWKDISDVIASKLNSDGSNTTTTFDLEVAWSSFRIRLDAWDMKFTDDNNVEISLSTIAAAAWADRKTAISNADTTPWQLDDKIVAWNWLNKVIGTPAWDETLDLSLDIIETNWLVITWDQLDIVNWDESNFGTSKKASDAENITWTENTKFITSKQLSTTWVLASDVLREEANTERTVVVWDDWNWVTLKQINVWAYTAWWTIRVKLDAKKWGVTQITDYQFRILVDDVAEYTSWNLTNETYQEYINDVAVSAYSTVKIQLKPNCLAAGCIAYTQDFNINYDEVLVPKAPTIIQD